MEEEPGSPEGNEQVDYELDLTNAHLPSLEDIHISPSLEAVDLTCNRLQTIDERILALTNLRKLSLRQNLLENADALSQSKSRPVMEDLELRDNLFQSLPVLSGFVDLQRLEISYNEIRSMAGISSLGSSNLRELYLAANKIPKIEGLDAISSLHILELGSNRIRVIENICHMTSLTQLWLGRNRIQQIENLGVLKNLKQLSLQSNRLERMQGIEECLGLEELYLSHNGISIMEGLAALTNLRVLDLGNNRLSEISNVETLNLLEDLWLNDNNIESWHTMYEALEGPRQSLTTVYLEKNPVADDPMYRRKMAEVLPNLTQLDANAVRRV